MNFEEHAAKSLILAPTGIPVPRGELCVSAREAADAVRRIGPAVIKAQVAIGGRGKAGGIKLVNTPEEAEQVASAILGMTSGPYKVERVGRGEGQHRARVLSDVLSMSRSASR